MQRNPNRFVAFIGGYGEVIRTWRIEPDSDLPTAGEDQQARLTLG